MTATPAETRAEVEKLERKHAENPEGRYFVPLANAYRRSGDVGRAISVLRSGLGKHPEYVSAHIVLGRCFADEGNREAAGAEFEHVLSLDPQNLVALRTLGEIASQGGDLDAARGWYGKLLAVDPMNEEARRAIDTLSANDSAPPAQPVPQQDTDDPAPQTSAVDGLDGVDAPSRFTLHSSVEPAEEEAQAPRYESGEALVTETIAELYTRQGFYDRAADVYRELLRRRGPDSRLEGRLERVLRLASGGEDDVIDAEPASIEPVSSSAGAGAVGEDPFADSFSLGFPTVAGTEGHELESAIPGGPVGPDGDPVRQDGVGQDGDSLGQDGDAAIAGSILGYLRGLLDWGIGAEPSHDEESTPDPEETVGGAVGDAFAVDDEAIGGDEVVFGWEEVSTTQDVVAFGGDEVIYGSAEVEFAEEVVTFVDTAVDFGDVATDTPSDEVTSSDGVSPSDRSPDVDDFDTDDSFAAPSFDEAESVGGGIAPAQPMSDLASIIEGLPDDELFPWELPSHDDELSEPSAQPSRHDSPEPRFSYDDGGGVTRSSHTPVTPDFEPPAPSPPAAESETPAPSSEGSEEEDDDLESFQAWLRSLKR